MAEQIHSPPPITRIPCFPLLAFDANANLLDDDKSNFHALGASVI